MIVWIMAGLLGTASDGRPESVASVSALNARREAFSGKEVIVHGYLWIGPEQLYIVDRRFDNDDAWDRASGCLSLLNVGDIGKYDNAFNGKYVELTGTFVANSDAYGVSLMACGETGIDLHAAPGKAVKVLDGAPSR